MAATKPPDDKAVELWKDAPPELAERMAALGYHTPRELWTDVRKRQFRTTFDRFPPEDLARFRLFHDLVHAYKQVPAHKELRKRFGRGPDWVDSDTSGDVGYLLLCRDEYDRTSDRTSPSMRRDLERDRNRIREARRQARRGWLGTYWQLVMPKFWVIGAGGPEGSMFLLYPLYCLASIGVIWGFVLVVSAFFFFAHGMAGVVQTWNIPAPYSLALTGHLTGQADRNAWAHLIVMAVLVSPLFSIWGYLKAGGANP